MRVIDILDRVTDLYNDKEYWRLDERGYLRFLDDAINQLILSRPDANTVRSVVQLEQGTQQTIPDNGYAFIDIYMNKKLNDDGTYSNYRPVWQVQRQDLDYFDNWQGVTKAPNVDYINEFAYDPRSPRVFWVTPYVGETPVFVEMDYSCGINKYATMADPLKDIEQMEIPISEVFKGPIISYILYLLYSTDSTSVVDRQVASQYEASFYQGLQLEYNAINIVNPKVEDAEAAAAIRQAS